MSKKVNQDDLIALAERIVAAAEEIREETGEVRVLFSTSLVRALLELAKRAPKPRGRQQVSDRERVYEELVLELARSRKEELIAGGMRRGAAHQKAVEEAAAKLKDRNIAARTVSRRMQRRRRR